MNCKRKRLYVYGNDLITISVNIVVTKLLHMWILLINGHNDDYDVGRSILSTVFFARYVLEKCSCVLREPLKPMASQQAPKTKSSPKDNGNNSLSRWIHSIYYRWMCTKGIFLIVFKY